MALNGSLFVIWPYLLLVRVLVFWLYSDVVSKDFKRIELVYFPAKVSLYQTNPITPDQLLNLLTETAISTERWNKNNKKDRACYVRKQRLKFLPGGIVIPHFGSTTIIYITF